MTYPEYLKTQHWQRTRKAALDLYGGRCAMCLSDTYLNVHHTTYQKDGRSIWFNENPETDLIALCKDCHKTMHRAEKLDPDRLAHATASMIGGNLIAELPSSGRYTPPKTQKIPDLPSTKRMHLWTQEEKQAYKALKKKRLAMMMAQRGGK